VLGDTSQLDNQEFLRRHAFIVGIGDTRIRRKLSEEILAQGGWLAKAVHPTAIVSADVTIGEGTVIMAGAIINTGSKIGRFTVVNTGAIIDHDNILEDGVHVSPGCQLAGWVHCAQDAFIGTGASVIPRKRVGHGSVVAAGATVIFDVAPRTMVAGTPARFKRDLGN
jgi:sugar O-acyltransferase (sialic acid O-acetyltransferase NeuD family)